MKNKKTAAFVGIFAGFLNGLFGSGGGILAVPLLRKSGFSQKESQATALFIMFFLSIFSAGIYFYKGYLSFSDAFVFVPGGIIGAIFASVCFKKIKPALLRKIFGGFVTFSAIKMLWGIFLEWIG